MSHDHGSLSSRRSLFFAIIINFALSVVQIIGGIASGSLALIADALHNTSDAVSLVIAYIAQKMGRKPADKKRTFGYKKIETVAALVNLTATLVTGAYVLIEAVLRFFDRSSIDGWMLIWISIVAIVVDFVTVGLTYLQSKESLNFKAVFLHNLADGLASIGVLASGILIISFEAFWVDPLAALLIAIFITGQAVKPFKDCVRLLIDSAPEGVDLSQILKEIESINFIKGVHHLHVWKISESKTAAEAHIVVDSFNAEKLSSLKTEIKKLLLNQFSIEHVSLEFEFENDKSCDQIVRGKEGTVTLLEA